MGWFSPYVRIISMIESLQFLSFPLLAKGFAIGLSVAVPVGPMAVLCVHRILDLGRRAGFMTGLGIATADACYASVAAFGLNFLSDRLFEYQFWLKLVGGLFLLALGTRIFLSPPARHKPRAENSGTIETYFSAFLWTLSNPPTIFLYLALFTTIGAAGREAGKASAAWLVGGVFLGSAFWWLALSEGVNLMGRKMNLNKFRWLNHLSGAVIGGFGLMALISLLRK